MTLKTTLHKDKAAEHAKEVSPFFLSMLQDAIREVAPDLNCTLLAGYYRFHKMGENPVETQEIVVQ